MSCEPNCASMAPTWGPISPQDDSVERLNARHHIGIVQSLLDKLPVDVGCAPAQACLGKDGFIIQVAVVVSKLFPHRGGQSLVPDTPHAAP